MLTGPNVIFTLKIAVLAVTLLFLSSLVALARRNYRLHGRINLCFFLLTLVALGGLEVVARLIEPELFNYFDEDQRQALSIHLGFSMPAALIMPLMLFTGLRHHRRVHLALATVFGTLWVGTFVTGLFLL